MDTNVEYDSYAYDSNFKTLDSYDYSSIATVDVKRNIYDISVNKTGSQIAIVENQGTYDSGQESVIRIYNVGRKKNSEDDAVSFLSFLVETHYFLFIYNKRRCLHTE